MKNISINKFVLFFLICVLTTCFCVCNLQTQAAAFAASKPSYAQIKNSNTYLYKSAEQGSTTNKWCLIEKSYFVKILNNYNSEFYKVEYNGINGFVRKDEIVLVNEIPLNPYPQNITFSTTSTSCYLRSAPKIKDVTDNTLAVIPSNSTGLKYIGKIIGEEAIDFGGSIWYLTNYNNQLGYVYSGYTTSITPISENIEQVTKFKGNDFSKINPLTNIECLIIIAISLIPCVIILFLLYAPKKSLNLKAKNNSTKSNYKDIANFYDENLWFNLKCVLLLKFVMQ